MKKLSVFDIEVELMLKDQNKSTPERHKWSLIAIDREDINEKLEKVLSLEAKVETYHIISIYHRGFVDMISTRVQMTIGEQWMREKIAETALQRKEDFGNNKTSLDWI